MTAPRRPAGGDAPALPVSADSVAANLAAVRQRIAAAGGDPARVRVVAVTKGFGPRAVAAAVASGLHDLGENYAQELLAKAAVTRASKGSLAGGEADPATVVPVVWHFLGPIQRNKVPGLAPVVALWHSLERVEAGQAIARHQPGGRVLVQVNVSREATKHGCSPEAVPSLVAALRGLGLDVAGLMAVGPDGPPEKARPGFRELADMASRLGLRELSMGMSSDLDVAVEEGATMVRVGRSLFGPRPQPAPTTPVGSLNGGN